MAEDLPGAAPATPRPATPADQRIPCIAQDLRVAAIDDGCVAWDVTRRTVRYLNATAALILTLCDGQRTIAAIRDAVCGIAPTVASASIDDWFDDAFRRGLLTHAGDSPPPPLTPMSAAQLVAAAELLRNEDDDTTRAFHCQRLAAELAPDDPAIWRSLGELAHIEKHRGQARDAYRRYLQLVGHDAEIEHIVRALEGELPARAPDECIRELYARFAGFYDHNMRDELDYRAPELLRDRLTAGIVASPDRAVLDLGCGTGLIGALLRPWARRLTGVDLSPEMLALARKRGIYHALEEHELLDWLSRNTRRFDLIVACDVLIYFGDLAAVVAGLARALALGGRVGFTLEEHPGDGWRLLDSGRYAHSRSYLEQLVAGAGLRVLSLGSERVRYEYGDPVAALLLVATPA